MFLKYEDQNSTAHTLTKPTNVSESKKPALFKMMLILYGQTRVLPFKWHYSQLLTNLINPFRSKPEIFDLTLLFWLSLGGQALNKATGLRVDLPLKELDPAFDHLRPNYVFIHNDSSDLYQIPCNGTMPDWGKVTPRNAYFISIKHDLLADKVVELERTGNQTYDLILLQRVDGFWHFPIPTDIPAASAIAGRNLNPACGYGASDHFLFGRRDPMITVMKMWTNCVPALFQQARQDPLCPESQDATKNCYGLECIQHTWMVRNGIRFESNVDKYNAGYPHKWANDMKEILYEI